MNTVDISEEVKVLKVIRHICREVSRGCNQTTTATSKGMTKCQVIGLIYKRRKIGTNVAFRDKQHDVESST